MEDMRSKSGESPEILWRLPENMRAELSRPLGPVIKSGDVDFLAGKDVISVGDVCSITLYQRGIIPHLAIVDGKTRRSPHVAQEISAEETIFARNPEATITEELWSAVKKALSSEKRALIKVDGEEDLAALVCISLAPEGTYVVYGIPDKGICVIKVDRKTREIANNALSRMKSKTEASDGNRDNE